MARKHNLELQLKVSISPSGSYCCELQIWCYLCLFLFICMKASPKQTLYSAYYYLLRTLAYCLKGTCSVGFWWVYISSNFIILPSYCHWPMYLETFPEGTNCSVWDFSVFETLKSFPSKFLLTIWVLEVISMHLYTFECICCYVFFYFWLALYIKSSLESFKTESMAILDHSLDCTMFYPL